MEVLHHAAFFKPVRWCAGLAVLLLQALAGCAARPQPSVDTLYREARELLRTERLAPARLRTESALLRAPAGSPAYWKLRVLHVEILQSQHEFALAKKELNFQVPAGPLWAEEQARYRICQAAVDPDAAARLLDEAQALALSAGASDLLGAIALRKAYRQDSFAEAGKMLHQIVDDAARRNNPYLRMQATGILGFLLSQQSRYEEAILMSGKALSMAQALDAPNSQARARLNLGWSYYRLGDLDKALQYLEAAEAQFESDGDPSYKGRCLGDMANVFYSRHESGKALDAYKRALEFAGMNDRDSTANWFHNLANISIETGELDAGERYNNQAWAIWKDRPGHKDAYSMVNAGRIADRRKDFGGAEKLFRSVLEIRLKDDPVPLLYAHAGLAQALAHEGKHAQAQAEFRATDEAVERQRVELLNKENQLSYFSSVIAFYQDYVDYLMVRGRPQEALAIAESSRARGLLDRLRLAHVRGAPNTAAGLQRVAAASRSVLLSYWLGPEKSYLWVVTGSSVSAFPLPAEPRISAMVEAYDAFIQKAHDPLNTENPAGSRLYDTLIAPAAALLPKDAKVILVPDGPLHALNFETLPVSAGMPHYWIEDVTLSIAPSLDLVSLDSGARTQTAPSLLLIGNPVSPDAQYPALEFAGQEMAAVRRNLAAFRQVVREGVDAEPEAYARAAPGRFGFIHFSAHAVANPEDPLESAVILSRHGAEFRLRAKDVLGTPLHADLVTISACRSAGARIYAGEGLVGLAWAFLEAGAHNVIAGLWDVNDRSTADLADGLYAGLARGLDPADALRAAKLLLIRSSGAYRKPYYWGPFEVFTRQAGSPSRARFDRRSLTAAARK